jgi:hypothetical protein
VRAILQCDIYRNVGAVMQINNDSFDFKLYDSVPHPYWMPHFESAFDITVPLLMQKLAEWLRSSLIAVRKEAKRVARSPRAVRSLPTVPADVGSGPALPPALTCASPPSSPDITPPSSPPPELVEAAKQAATAAAAGAESDQHGDVPVVLAQQDAGAVAATTAGTADRPQSLTGHNRRRESLAKIRPGTVTSRLSEFGAIEKSNTELGPAKVAPIEAPLSGIMQQSRQ